MSDQDQVVSVRLRRNTTSTPWGFRMQGGHEYGSALFIQTVSPKSLSARQGLHVGDRLLAIGPAEAHHMSHDQAKMEIIRAGNELDLIVQRRPGQHGFDQTDAVKVPKQHRHEATEEPTEYRGYTNPNVQSRSFKILKQSLSMTEANEEGIVLRAGGTPGEGIVRKAYSEGKQRLEELSEINPRNFTNEGESPYRYNDFGSIREDDKTRLSGAGSGSGRQGPGEGIVRKAYSEGKQRLEELSEINPHNFTNEGESPYRYNDFGSIREDDETRLSGAGSGSGRQGRRRDKPEPSMNVAASKTYEGLSPERKVPQIDISMSSVLSPAAGQQQYIQQAKTHYQTQAEPHAHKPAVHQTQSQTAVSHHTQSQTAASHHTQSQMAVSHHTPSQTAVSYQASSNQRPLKLVNYNFDNQYGHGAHHQQTRVISQHKSTDFIPSTKTVSSVAAELGLMHADRIDHVQHASVHEGIKYAPPPVQTVQNISAQSKPLEITVQSVAPVKTQEVAPVKTQIVAPVTTQSVAPVKTKSVAPVAKHEIRAQQMAVVEQSPMTFGHKPPTTGVQHKTIQSSSVQDSKQTVSTVVENKAPLVIQEIAPSKENIVIDETVHKVDKTAPKEVALKAVHEASNKLASNDVSGKLETNEEKLGSSAKAVLKETVVAEPTTKHAETSTTNNVMVVETETVIESISKEEKPAPKDIASKVIEDISQKLTSKENKIPEATPNDDSKLKQESSLKAIEEISDKIVSKATKDAVAEVASEIVQKAQDSTTDISTPQHVQPVAPVSELADNKTYEPTVVTSSEDKIDKEIASVEEIKESSTTEQEQIMVNQDGSEGVEQKVETVAVVETESSASVEQNANLEIATHTKTTTEIVSQTETSTEEGVSIDIVHQDSNEQDTTHTISFDMNANGQEEEESVATFSISADAEVSIDDAATFTITADAGEDQITFSINANASENTAESSVTANTVETVEDQVTISIKADTRESTAESSVTIGYDADVEDAVNNKKGKQAVEPEEKSKSQSPKMKARVPEQKPSEQQSPKAKAKFLDSQGGVAARLARLRNQES